MKKLALISVAVVAALFLAVSAFAATKTLTTSLKGGSAETPKGDPNGKGTAKITFNTSTGRVCFKLTWSGIGTPTAAHIHKGKKGVAGPVVVPIFGGAPKHSGCVKAPSKSTLRSLARSPGSYYVNVHTQAFPGGAIRGQL
jgi:CHRD domain